MQPTVSKSTLLNMLFIVIWLFLCHYGMVAFWMTLLMKKVNHVLPWMMVDEFHPLAKTLTGVHLSPPTCDDEMLSWVIEIWMKIHLVSDYNCNTVNL